MEIQEPPHQLARKGANMTDDQATQNISFRKGPCPVGMKEAMEYFPDTGLFIWRNPPKYHPRLMNQIAGCIRTGYVMIKIEGLAYKAHRLAWLYMTGEWPSLRIDHKNGVSIDNRWVNLRLCDQTSNNGNKKRNKGKRLPKGVRCLGSKYQARIKYRGQAFHLGSFSTPDLAAEAYLKAATNLFGEFARAS